jgi:hypothetical protein
MTSRNANNFLPQSHGDTPAIKVAESARRRRNRAPGAMSSISPIVGRDCWRRPTPRRSLRRNLAGPALVLSAAHCFQPPRMRLRGTMRQTYKVAAVGIAFEFSGERLELRIIDPVLPSSDFPAGNLESLASLGSWPRGSLPVV